MVDPHKIAKHLQENSSEYYENALKNLLSDLEFRRETIDKDIYWEDCSLYRSEGRADCLEDVICDIKKILS